MVNTFIMITIMCMYNDYKTLQDNLVKSLNNQSIKPQLILIDNRTNQYHSHAEAYNAHLDKIENENVIFTHQDVILKDDLNVVIDYLNIFSNSIMGTAGTSTNGVTYSNITHGINEAYAGNKRIIHHNHVETLDEHFFFLKTHIILDLRFNESIPLGFHLYAVELCLRAKLNKIKIYAINYNLHHLSKGNTNHDFLKALSYLAKHYQKSHKTFYLTTGLFDTKRIIKINQPNTKKDYEIQGLKKRFIGLKSNLTRKSIKKLIKIFIYILSKKFKKEFIYRKNQLDFSVKKADSFRFLNEINYNDQLIFINCNEGNVYKVIKKSQVKAIYHESKKLANPISNILEKPLLLVRTPFKNNEKYVPYLDLRTFNKEIIVTTDIKVYKYIMRSYQNLKIIYIYRLKKNNHDLSLKFEKVNF